MKKLLCVLVILLFFLAGCNAAVVQTEEKPDSSMFVVIERAKNWLVVYHKETKVMYAVCDGSYNRGGFTLLVNPDGTPMTWEGNEHE